jgi:hypothetical protein
MQAAVAIIFTMLFSATLNPDGSGKVVIEITQAGHAPKNAATGKDQGPREAMLDFAKQMLEGSKGVEAWSDVSVSAIEGGITTFKATAYFRDLAKVDLAVPGTTPDAPGVSWAADPKGGMILSLDLAHGMPPVAPEPQVMTPEELARKVTLSQTLWNMRRADLEQSVKGTRFEFSFRLPGPAAEVSGFKKGADGAVQFAMDSAKMFQAMDQLMTDAAYVGQCIKEGRKPADDRRDPILNEKMFGSKGPWTARVTSDMKPQFDYAAEVKAAKDAYPAMLRKLGLPQPPPKAKAKPDEPSGEAPAAKPTGTGK